MAIWDDVADEFGYTRMNASIQQKMVNKEDLNTIEADRSKGVDFAFFSLACVVSSRSTEAESFYTLRGNVERSTATPGATGEFDERRFIRELVQNARDVLIESEAAQFKLELNNDGFVFEHNGRPFSGSYSDGRGMGEAYCLFEPGRTTKALDFSTVGQFGIGFKGWMLFYNQVEIICDDGLQHQSKIAWGLDAVGVGNVELNALENNPTSGRRFTHFNFTNARGGRAQWNYGHNIGESSTRKLICDEIMQLIATRDDPIDVDITHGEHEVRMEHKISTPRHALDEDAPRIWYYETETEIDGDEEVSFDSTIIELEVMPHTSINEAVVRWIERQLRKYEGMPTDLNPFLDDQGGVLDPQLWYGVGNTSQRIRFCLSKEDDFHERSWISNLVPVDFGTNVNDHLVSESRWLIDAPFFLDDSRGMLNPPDLEANGELILQSMKNGFSSLCHHLLELDDGGWVDDYRKLIRLPPSTRFNELMTFIRAGVQVRSIFDLDAGWRDLHEMTGDVYSVFHNCNDDPIQNAAVRKLDSSWRVGETSLISAIEEIYSEENADVLGSAFPELPTILDYDEMLEEWSIEIVTSDHSALMDHVTAYSSSEVYQNMNESGLMDILEERYPMIRREDWAAPPLPLVNRIIFGDSESEDDLKLALGELQDDYEFMICSDPLDELYICYANKASEKEWKELTVEEKSLQIIRAPPECNHNWMIDKMLDCIAHSGQPLDGDFLDLYHDTINEKCKHDENFDWVSSDTDVYGDKVPVGFEKEHRMWIKLTFVAAAARGRSILFDQGSVWNGNWSSSMKEWSIISNNEQLEKVNDFASCLIIPSFQSVSSFGGFEPGENIALLGGSGLICPTLQDTMSAILRQTGFEPRHYIVVVNVPPDILSERVHNSWSLVPRFIAGERFNLSRAPDGETRDGKKERFEIDRAALNPATSALPGNWNTLLTHVKSDRGDDKLLCNIFDLQMTENCDQLESDLPIILVREMGILDVLIYHEDLFNDLDGEMIGALWKMNYPGDVDFKSQKLLRKFAIHVFKGTTDWRARGRKINDFGLTAQDRNLSHNQGAMEAEDAIFDELRTVNNISNLGFELKEEFSIPNLLIASDADELIASIDDSICVLNSNELIRMEQCPEELRSHFFDSIVTITQHLSNVQAVDNQVIELAIILSENLGFAAGTNEDGFVELTVVRECIEGLFDESIVPKFRDDFLPLVENEIDEDIFTNLTRLLDVLSTTEGASLEEILDQIRELEQDPDQAWDVYQSKRMWPSDPPRIWLFNNNQYRKSSANFDDGFVLISEEQEQRYFPHGMHEITGQRKLTGWRPPDAARICVLPQEQGIDFMLQCQDVPALRFNPNNALSADPSIYACDEDDLERWSFLLGLIGLYYHIRRGSTNFEFPVIMEGGATDECTSYSFGNQPLRLGLHGWDLKNDDGSFHIITDQPHTPSQAQLVSLKTFVKEIFEINDLEIRSLLLNDGTIENPSLSNLKRNGLTSVLKTERKILDPLLEQMFNRCDGLDFWNPFHRDRFDDNIENQDDLWWEKHVDVSSNWKDGLSDCLNPEGAKRNFDYYQEAILGLLSNPTPADEFQEICASLKIRVNRRLDNTFENDLYHGFHSMLMDEPRIWTPVDGVAPKMHISRLHGAEREYKLLLEEADLWDFPGNILFVSPFTAHRMSMTANPEGIQKVSGERFGAVFSGNRELRECLFKIRLESWGDDSEEYVTLKDVMEFNDDSSRQKMSLKVHKFHFMLIAAMDAAVREHISERDASD